MVFCVITAPLTGYLYAATTRSVMVINILIVACYILFMCFLKKVRIGYDIMKNVYRSLIAISLAVVFGSFSTTFISSFAEIFKVNIERPDVDLMSGLFINTSCSINFFIFYAFSKDYREVFQEYLFCARTKPVTVANIS
ncbi:hypothetical protein GCK32_007275 [Trichostrongylus colubriformis]|uniref:Uncharacterized protein n=1 Tax=Trichostrongylus colubriformis TaxID=6319 RepID=A0AAN8FLA2_TRICO